LENNNREFSFCVLSLSHKEEYPSLILLVVRTVPGSALNLKYRI